MFGILKKTTKTTEEILVAGKVYKLNIIRESRKNSRVSITKSGINIRIDKRLPKAIQNNQFDKFLLWAKETITEKGHVFEKAKKTFHNDDVLNLYDGDVTLKIIDTEKTRVSGKIHNDILQANIPKNISEENKQKYLSKLITRLLKKKYYSKIEAKIVYFNEKFQFGKINEVRLKNNATNWGSCSSKNNINISVRLFLAPEFVVDYVIIHELSHLIHRNHSKSFWKLVEKCCPNYKEAEFWLKQNASKCVI